MSFDHSSDAFRSGISGLFRFLSFGIQESLTTSLSYLRLSATRASLIAFFSTFWEALDIPVYWPILVIYFFVLFTLTMRRQIQCVLVLSRRSPANQNGF